ncbi:hypothetical protein CGGC5_v005899 [Colletotrichum fructicola Nara gc5]|uniref:Uncharacterized protein n=1 Tax=Colletotrichum fructicola (strain Nara gc5) TaxID=1213859 RepID=A0A7J6JAF0_COLFN|nr:hypothetical protein CGGC5_v005899 [Colletotrichum fructicola Nara gc5]
MSVVRQLADEEQYKSLYKDDASNATGDTAEQDRDDSHRVASMGGVPELVDGPLDGVVYTLMPMDVIKIIVNGGCAEIFLTVPDNGAPPFVSFKCPSGHAREFVTERRQFM